MSSTNGSQPVQTGVKWYGLVRTPENGGRRARTLRDDAGTAQVQAKVTTVHDEHDPDGSRYLQIRFWTEEGGWGHLVIEPGSRGIAGIIGIGYGDGETDSWQMARQQVSDGYGVQL
jgi:hypothetical protein